MTSSYRYYVTGILCALLFTLIHRKDPFLLFSPTITTNSHTSFSTQAVLVSKVHRTIESTSMPSPRPTLTPRMIPKYCNLHSSPPLIPKCYRNNSYCGDWNVTQRTFRPAVNSNTNVYDDDQCQLRLFTPAEARKCLGNRTLAFMGDSMIRDLATGISLFLQGMTVEESLDIKFDHQDKFAC